MNDTVYVPEGGDCYHNREDCPNMGGGQTKAEREGNTVHEVIPTPRAEAKARKKPCSFCVGE